MYRSYESPAGLERELARLQDIRADIMRMIHDGIGDSSDMEYLMDISESIAGIKARIAAAYDDMYEEA